MGNNQIKLDNEEIFMTFLKSFEHIMAGISFSSICTFIFIKGADKITKIIIIPFLICSITVLIKGFIILFRSIIMVKLINTEKENVSNNKLKKMHNTIKKIENSINKFYVVIFLTYWFGFLVIIDYISIKEWKDGGNSHFFLSFIFWFIGICIASRILKKKK